MNIEHSLIVQLSPDIAPERVVNVVLGRLPELKGGKPRFERSNLPLDVMLLASGGAYWEMWAYFQGKTTRKGGKLWVKRSQRL